MFPLAGILSQLAGEPDGAQVLYAAILQQKPDSGSAGMYQRGRLQKQAPLLPPPRRIPTKHHAFVTALGQVIGTALAPDHASQPVTTKEQNMSPKDVCLAGACAIGALHEPCISL